jgi:hypothetical protein
MIGEVPRSLRTRTERGRKSSSRACRGNKYPSSMWNSRLTPAICRLPRSLGAMKWTRSSGCFELQSGMLQCAVLTHISRI